jgi:hypothetical protein
MGKRSRDTGRGGELHMIADIEARPLKEAAEFWSFRSMSLRYGESKLSRHRSGFGVTVGLFLVLESRSKDQGVWSSPIEHIDYAGIVHFVVQTQVFEWDAHGKISSPIAVKIGCGH